MTVEQLRRFLADKRMTQRQLAEALDLSEERISRIMHNGPELPKAMIGRLVLAFGAQAIISASQDESPA